jgi:hypothetical protein
VERRGVAIVERGVWLKSLMLKPGDLRAVRMEKEVGSSPVRA